MPAALRRLEKATAIARQLVTHNGYLLRRIAQESLGAVELASAVALQRMPVQVPVLQAAQKQLLAWSERHNDAVLLTALRLGGVSEALGDTAGALAAYQRVVDRMRRRQAENILVKLLGRLVRNTGQGGNLGEAVAHADVEAFEEALVRLTRLGADASVPQTPWQDPASWQREHGVATGADLAQQRLATLGATPDAAALRAWLAQDADDAQAWRLLAEACVQAAQHEEGAAACRRAIALEPTDAAAWRALALSLDLAPLAAAKGRRKAPAATTPDAAAQAWRRASDLDPSDAEAFWRARGVAVRRVVELDDAGVPATIHAGSDAALRLGIGEAGSLDFGITLAKPANCVRWALAEPYGLGVTVQGGVQPQESGPHSAGTRLSGTWTLRGNRPHHILAPADAWTVVLQLWVDGEALAMPVQVAVDDDRPGELLWIITEDHELHEHDHTLTVQMAREILVDVSTYAQDLAGDRNVPWTHMVESGSALALLEWTAAQAEANDPDPAAVQAWRCLRDDAKAALAEGVARGHDLGIHLHAFNTPACANFAYAYDTERHALVCSDRFLLAHGPERGYFAKAFARLGDSEDPDARLGGLLAAIEAIENVGRLGQPGFQTLLFRAGSFEFSAGGSDDVRSMRALRRLGVPADSSWPKPSFYTSGPPRNPLRASCEGYQRPAQGLADHGTLEIRAEYNIEGDYLSDASTLERYLRGRIAHFAPGGVVSGGVHIVCAMTHDKYINGRMGRSALPLHPDNGDWTTVLRHLDAVDGLRHILTPVTAGQAVRRWLDVNAPEPIALRCDEELQAGLPDGEEESFRIRFSLYGRDIPIDPDHPARVELRVPAVLRRQVLRADAWADGQFLGSHADTAALSRLEPFAVLLTRRPLHLDLVVHCARGERLLGCALEPGGRSLVADLQFRVANVRLPDGRLRSGLRFEPGADGRFHAAL